MGETREVVMITGREGMNRFDRILRLQVALEQVRHYPEDKKIRLMSMLSSQDNESVDLAIEIILNDKLELQHNIGDKTAQ